LLWLKWVPPIRCCAPSRELAAPRVVEVLAVFARARARMTVGVTAALGRSHVTRDLLALSGLGEPRDEILLARGLGERLVNGAL
jgi:hypothetical protein